jgi:hypothetical protein
MLVLAVGANSIPVCAECQLLGDKIGSLDVADGAFPGEDAYSEFQVNCELVQRECRGRGSLR